MPLAWPLSGEPQIKSSSRPFTAISYYPDPSISDLFLFYFWLDSFDRVAGAYRPCCLCCFLPHSSAARLIRGLREKNYTITWEEFSISFSRAAWSKGRVNPRLVSVFIRAARYHSKVYLWITSIIFQFPRVCGKINTEWVVTPRLILHMYTCVHAALTLELSTKG